MRIKKNDTIKVITGKDRGKTGKISKVYIDKNAVLVEGVNIYKKHVRPKRQGEKGEIVQLPRPLDVSNVMLVCSTCGKPTRIKYRREGKTKIRICQKCQGVN